MAWSGPYSQAKVPQLCMQALVTAKAATWHSVELSGAKLAINTRTAFSCCSSAAVHITVLKHAASALPRHRASRIWPLAGENASPRAFQNQRPLAPPRRCQVATWDCRVGLSWPVFIRVLRCFEINRRCLNLSLESRCMQSHSHTQTEAGLGPCPFAPFPFWSRW